LYKLNTFLTVSNIETISDPVIYFDGICNLCNGFVQFIIRHDKKELFRFASLQSSAGQEILRSLPHPQYSDTIILRLNGKLYTRSSAALEIIKRLHGATKLLYGFIIVPVFIRDWIYKQVAKHRYQWFGKKDQCMLPDPRFKNRFIN